MADTTPDTESMVRLECPCGGAIQMDPELLGRMVRCPHCSRTLRVGLQFLLADVDVAPNIAAACPCGRFVVEDAAKAGKRAECGVCGRKLILPRPIERPGSPPVVRIPARVLKKQLRRVGAKRTETEGEPQRQPGPRVAFSPSSPLKEGSLQCPNPECGAPIPEGGKVCLQCGTNVVTGEIYEGPGPSEDPTGEWSQ